MNREVSSQPCVRRLRRQAGQKPETDQLEGSHSPPKKRVEGEPEIADSSEMGKEQMLRKELTQS